MTNFIERIGFERKVLKLVNSNIQNTQLTGLTQAALETWKHNHKVSGKVFNLLYELSTVLKTINQRSGEIFNSTYQENSLKCEQLFSELKQALGG
ncbi:hypothetical protein [Alteromonas gilva]|uniref:Uncharacterized protein n=1 Tax=Alteromonas gilva TaxID=2987522 RepID=A0ABT5L1P2_9ALTE|nr:hypothetical protein [Alteromonas gilva]MDC8829718.1 hypothetical protein [Alteromonas gilva]